MVENVRLGNEEEEALRREGDSNNSGCDFFGSVTYTHISVRRFAKFFPSHAKVSYAKVSYLRICYVNW